jgi:ankyrin repeat protein
MSKVILSYLFKTNLATFRSAIIEDNTDKICRILDIERDYLNKDIDSGGNTALLLAIKYASPLTIRLLLEQGAQPDQINEVTLQTPLGLIASTVYEDYNSYKAQRLLEMAKILLDHGAYIDKPSIRHYKAENKQEYSAKETPLMTAVRKRNVPLVNFLIERKANIDYTERQLQIQAYVFISNKNNS